jgi:hypothetical protein
VGMQKPTDMEAARYLLQIYRSYTEQAPKPPRVRAVRREEPIQEMNEILAALKEVVAALRPNQT